MENLIEALQIFLKYRNDPRPTVCVHDYLIIHSIEEDDISEEDKIRLEELGFDWYEEYGWCSSEFGSA
jgi:hypothetical protein